jgi:hypothetical protein
MSDNPIGRTAPLGEGGKGRHGVWIARDEPCPFLRSAGRHHAARQLSAPEITGPNSFQVVPSNFISCICLIGA